MEVIRYINNERVRGNRIPRARVDNPAVVRVLRDVNRRIISAAATRGEGDAEGDEHTL